MKFIYPLSLEVGDKVVMTDDGKRFTLTVESTPSREGERIFVWTDKQLLQLDPGLKVMVDESPASR